MSSALYLMPPITAKSDLLRQLLTGPHTSELFLDENGEPVLAVVINTKRQSARDNALLDQILRLIAKASEEHFSQTSLLLVHSLQPQPTVYQVQPELWIDLDQYEVRRGQERLSLHAREAELLRILLRNPRRYIKADVLAEAIGAVGAEETEHPVESMISELRRKFGEPPYHPQLLRNKRNAGYAIFPTEGL